MRLWCLYIGLSYGCWATAQFNTGGSGQQYLSPTEGVTVGTSTGLPPSALTVRGSEMTTPTGEVFRTIGHYASGTELETNWRLFRLQSNGVGREMGRLYATDSPLSGSNNFTFNIQQMVQGSSLWLRNESFDGIRLPDNAANAPSFTLNGITNTGQRYGYVAIGLAGQMVGASEIPWTRLHLVHQFNASDTAAFRSFMKNGVTMSGSHDAMYVGQKHVPDGTQDVSDATDALFSWFEGALAVGDHDYDNATFRFLTTPGAANTGAAGGVEGLEIMRLYPYRATSTSAIEGFVGLGNWAAGANRPSERLDLLDRTIRLRNFVDATAYRNDTYDRVLVANPADGRVYWRSASSIVSTGDCEWSLGGGANNNNLWTALGASTTCPNQDNLVGIGSSTPLAKLHVERDNTTSGSGVTGYFAIAGTSTDKAGVVVEVVGTGSNHTGFRVGTVNASNNNLGIETRATLTPGVTNTYNTGIHSLAWVQENTTNALNYGVLTVARADVTGGWNFALYADVAGNDTVRDWAGYFLDRVQILGNLWHGTSFIFSDEQLKTDVELIETSAATDLLAQLAPKTYHYATAQFPHMNLASGTQFGFLANEVAQVLPELVSTTMVTPIHGENGEVLVEEMEVMGVNYEGMVPLLVASNQELVSRIETLQEQLTLIQAQVSGCCGGGMAPQGGGSPADVRMGENTAILGNERNLQIQPNPFNERTTLYYALERSGRMQLMANSADGKQLRVLSEANLEAGQYQFEWNTADLAPGIYYVTLLLDGEPIVKKAVKVQR